MWIMSQRILIRLRGGLYSFGHHLYSEMIVDVAAQLDKQADRIVIARNLQSAKDVAKAIRSQFDSVSPVLETITTADVQVRVEQSVSVEYEPHDYDRDHDRKPSFAWDSRS